MNNVAKSSLFVGQKLLSIGSDANCFDCISACYVHTVGENPIVGDRPVGHKGFIVRMYFDELNGDGINGFFEDTTANRKMLREHCQQTRAEWQRGVDEQMARIAAL